MRLVLIAVVLILIAAGAGWWFMQGQSSVDSSQSPSSGTQAKLAPEVESILTEKTNTLMGLAAEASIVSAVRASNEKNKSVSMEEIQRLDEEWQESAGVTSFIAQFMSNPTALSLVAFQKDHPEFKEIFVADAYGLNVGQTDKTSDYYQADESWWTDSFAGGRGHTLHGSIEFDESSQTEAISLYVPVMDGARAIGVFKGVLDLSEISSQL